MVTELDRFSIYFLLLRLEMCLCGQMVSTVCFNPVEENEKAGSIPLVAVDINVKFKNPITQISKLKSRLAHF